jgi:hypothetical protein
MENALSPARAAGPAPNSKMFAAGVACINSLYSEAKNVNN